METTSIIERITNKQYFAMPGAASLLLLFALGCSHQQHSIAAASTAAPAATQSQFDQIQKHYSVTVMVSNRHITVRSNGEVSETKASQIKEALHKILGAHFNDYTVIFIVD